MQCKDISFVLFVTLQLYLVPGSRASDRVVQPEVDDVEAT